MSEFQRNVDVIVGLNAGSEAKGKCIAVLADQYAAHVRTGSVNAAHTTYFLGKGYPWHQIPCGALLAPKAWLILGAGAQISLEYLNREIQWLKDNNNFLWDNGVPRLVIDPNASIIDAVDIYAENGWSEVCGPQWYRPTTCDWHNGASGPSLEVKKAGTCEGCSLYPKDSLHRSLGSTTHGSGFNLIRKLARTDPDGVHAGMLRDAQGNKLPKVRLASEVEELRPYLGDTVELINDLNDAGRRVLLEGTQGSLLSVHHGYWPKTTSRDSNVSNWLMEAGISPNIVNKVYGVTRTFPIRVAGDSGPMGADEITWETVTKYAHNLSSDLDDTKLNEWLSTNNKKMIKEITTATKRMRRVFMFSDSDFMNSYRINRPDEMMLSFADYLNIDDFGKNTWNDLSLSTRDWITTTESRLGVHFKYVSTGPDNHQLIVRNTT